MVKSAIKRTNKKIKLYEKNNFLQKMFSERTIGENKKKSNSFQFQV